MLARACLNNAGELGCLIPPLDPRMSSGADCRAAGGNRIAVVEIQVGSGGPSAVQVQGVTEVLETSVQRRVFLAELTGASLISAAARSAGSHLQCEGKIMTVLGPRLPSEMGVMLPHEHVMSTFGLQASDQPVYDRAQLLQTVVPYLRTVKALGCTALADCTAARFGRAPDLLRQISRTTGIHVLTNAGYYGAAGDRYVPAQASDQTVDQIAALWLKEWRDGIDGTGVRPGFMKIGIDEGSLSPIDRKLVAAAARTHLGSGLTIAVHTGDNPEAAQTQLALLREASVSPRAWVWVHAQAVRDEKSLLWAGEQGAWLSFDGIGVSSLDRHLELVQLMKRAGRLDQVLLSHDGDAFPANTDPPRPFDALFTQFIPKLRHAGFTPAEIVQLTQGNPQSAFTIRVRSIAG
jgi:predicted metal-dependent phosphotriesterase family hydrolase